MTIKELKQEHLANHPTIDSWKIVGPMLIDKIRPLMENEGYVSGAFPYIASVDGTPTNNIDIIVMERETHSVAKRSRPESNGTFLISGLRFDRTYDIIGRDKTGVYQDILVQNVRPVPASNEMIVVESPRAPGSYVANGTNCEWTVFNASGEISAVANVPGTVVEIESNKVRARHMDYTGDITITITDDTDSKSVNFSTHKKYLVWRISVYSTANSAVFEGMKIFEDGKMHVPTVLWNNVFSVSSSNAQDIVGGSGSVTVQSSSTFYIGKNSYNPFHGIKVQFDEPRCITSIIFDLANNSSYHRPGFSKLEYLENDKWVEVSWFFDKNMDIGSSEINTTIPHAIHTYKAVNRATLPTEHSSYVLIAQGPNNFTQTVLDLTRLKFNDEENGNYSISTKRNEYSIALNSSNLRPAADLELRWASVSSWATWSPFYIVFPQKKTINKIETRHTPSAPDRIPTRFHVLIDHGNGHYTTDWVTGYRFHTSLTTTWNRNPISNNRGSMGVSKYLIGDVATDSIKDECGGAWVKARPGIGVDNIDKPFNNPSLNLVAGSSDSYFSLNTTASLNPHVTVTPNTTEPFAIDGWVKSGTPATGTSTYTLVERGIVLFSQNLWTNSEDHALWFGVDMEPTSSTYLKPVFGRGSRVFLQTTDLPEDYGSRIVGDIPITPGVWTHIALEYDGNYVRIYTNGAMCCKVRTNIGWSGYLTSSSVPPQIGKAWKTNSTYIGENFKLANIRVMNTAPWQKSFIPLDHDFDMVEGAETTIDRPEDSNATPKSILNFESGLSDTGTRARTWTAHGTAAVDNTRYKFGTRSLRTNGLGDLISTPVGSNLISGGQTHFTIQGWLWIDSSGQPTTSYPMACVLANTGATDSTTINFGVLLDGGYVATAQKNRMVFQRGTHAGTIAGRMSITNQTANVEFPRDQWVHVACTYDGNRIRLFQNGVKVSDEANTCGWSNLKSAAYTIGAAGASIYMRGAKANYDQIEIIDGECLYTDNFSVDGVGPPTEPEEPEEPGVINLKSQILNDSPWAYYKLDESTVPVSDLSGNMRHLTEIQGNPVFLEPGLLNEPGTSMKVLRTGPTAGDQVRSSNNAYGSDIETAFNGDKGWTVSAVINVSELGGQIFHIGNYAVYGCQGLWINTLEDGCIAVGTFTTSQWQNVYSDPGAIGTNETAIIHVTREIGGLFSIYKNGVLIKTGNMSNTMAGQSTSSGGVRISIGSATSSGASISDPASANIQDVAVYDRPLSPEKILAQANAAGFA